MHTHVSQNHEYRDVPVTALIESPSNPRKRFDENSLGELAASFKSQGVLAPLLVRELDESKYEVIAGARRLRAAKLAELENVPVRVVKLSDAEAIEAQCVENLQREDIHPLEEALGSKSLLELGEPYNIAHIAARAGKSEAYIYGRLRLADLIPPVAEAFLKDNITIGHALLIAKLPAAQQQEAFAAAFRSMWTSEGNTQVLIPVKELAAWIESNILLQLASVPFDKQDEALLPAAGFLHRPAMLPGKGGRSHRKDDGVETGACANFVCMEHPRRRTAWAQSLRGTSNQEGQSKRESGKATTVPKAL
jgi:ParB family transcriptional regulator, chromosome partitioning protein